MKLQAQNLKKIMTKKKVSVSEMVIRCNKLLIFLGLPDKIMCRQNFYDYFDGTCLPSIERIYLIAASLRTHPSKIFKIEIDEGRYAKYLDIVRKCS